MLSYRVVAVPEAIVQRARTERVSPQYGHPAHVELATGYGPCRACLETFREGQQRVLFTYDPFDGFDAYPSPGPIFIHQAGCQRYDEPSFPAALRALPLMLEGYGRERWLVARERIGDGDVDGAIQRLLADPAVAYIHVRNAEAGCFIAHVARA